MATSVDTSWEAAKKVLDEWEKSIGMYPVSVDMDCIQTIMNMTHADVQCMSALDAANYAFVLSGFATHLQSQSNRVDSFLAWANANKDRFSGLEKTRIYSMYESAFARTKRIAYMAKRVEFMAQMLVNLQRAKKEQQQ